MHATLTSARTLPVPAIAPTSERDWCLAHIADLAPRLEAATTPAERAIHGQNIAALQARVRTIAEWEAAGAWWHVVDEDGEHHVIAYQGNGGFGPVNVYRRGWFVPVRARERHPGAGPLACCAG